MRAVLSQPAVTKRVLFITMDVITQYYVNTELKKNPSTADIMCMIAQGIRLKALYPRHYPITLELAIRSLARRRFGRIAAYFVVRPVAIYDMPKYRERAVARSMHALGLLSHLIGMRPAKLLAAIEVMNPTLIGGPPGFRYLVGLFPSSHPESVRARHMAMIRYNHKCRSGSITVYDWKKLCGGKYVSRNNSNSNSTVGNKSSSSYYYYHFYY